MDDDTKKESEDQPEKESAEDQPEEKVSPSEEQPAEESEDEESSEEPKEESEEEETVEIDGEELSLEELKKGYMRQKDYTRKTQEFAALKKTEAPRKLSVDEEKIQTFIRDNNLLTKAELQQLLSDNEDLSSLKTLGITKQQEGVIRSLSRSTGTSSSGVPYVQATMREIYEDVYGPSGKTTTTPPVRKKVVGVTPKAGAKATGSKLTREAISGMSQAEYQKRRPEIMKAVAQGLIN